MRERCVRDAQHFVVVLVNAHLEVEAGELAQMAARVGILGAKNRTHLEHALEISRDRHLLVQLRRLREARRAPEVIGAEDLGPAFGLARDELGRVDLDKAALEQRLRAPRSLRFSRAPSGRTQRASVGAYLAKESAHARLDAHDGVVRGYAQVQPSVVEALLLADARERPVGVLRGVDFLLRPRRVFEQEREHVRSARDAIAPLELQLDVRLRARLDARLDERALDVDDTLERQLREPLPRRERACVKRGRKHGARPERARARARAP